MRLSFANRGGGGGARQLSGIRAVRKALGERPAWRRRKRGKQAGLSKPGSAPVPLTKRRVQGR
ncbi:Uncharacterised protein [Roseomonas gilardii subsp. rosea]|nr:Uncharacterised protein [Roseomonas gilardii subsp. rosea]